MAIFHDADLAPSTDVTAEVTATPSVESEAPDPSPAPEQTEGAEPSSAADDGSAQPRAADGRFAPKGPSPESATAPGVVDPAKPPASPAAPLTPPAPAVPEAPTRPFTFRANGSQHAIDGAAYGSDGSLTVPPAQVGLVKQLLSEGVAHRQTYRQKEAEFQTRVEEATKSADAREARWKGMFEHLYGLVQDPNALVSLVNGYDERYPLLKERLDLMYDRATSKMPQGAPKAAEDPKASQEAVQQAASTAFHEEMDDFLEQPEYASVFTGKELESLRARMEARWTSYFTQHEGETVLDRHALKAELDYELGLRTRANTQAAELAKAAARNASKTPPVPSVVPARGSPTPSETAGKPDKVKWAREHGFG